MSRANVYFDGDGDAVGDGDELDCKRQASSASSLCCSAFRLACCSCRCWISAAILPRSVGTGHCVPLDDELVPGDGDLLGVFGDPLGLPVDWPGVPIDDPYWRPLRMSSSALSKVSAYPI